MTNVRMSAVLRECLRKAVHRPRPSGTAAGSLRDRHGWPLRWSAARIERALGTTPFCQDRIPLDVALRGPDLLRAFITYAHALSGIRDDGPPHRSARPDLPARRERRGHPRFGASAFSQWAEYAR